MRLHLLYAALCAAQHVLPVQTHDEASLSIIPQHNSLAGTLNPYLGDMPATPLVSRPLPWWVLHGQGYTSH